MVLQMLKAAWKGENVGDEQYLCVDDCGNDEKDWLDEVPVPRPVLIDDAGTTELRLASMRRTLESDDELLKVTGYNRKEFGMIYRAFVARWPVSEWEDLERRRQYWIGRAGKRGPGPAADKYEDYVKNVPLLRDDPLRPSQPGNRCKLHPAYILLLDLMRKHDNVSQDRLEVTFGVDQSAVSKYVRVADNILAAMLPTPYRFMEILRGIDTPEQFATLFPESMRSDAILIDGTHVRFTRSSDKEVRDAMYSGKKKAYTGNTVLFTTPDKLVIAISDTYHGSVHDITITREMLKDLGAFATGVLGAVVAEADAVAAEADAVAAEADAVAAEADAVQSEKNSPNTSPRPTMLVLGDSGFQGLEKNLPGAKVETPHKRPRGGQLTKQQKAHNKKLSKERVLVENAIMSVKHFRRASSIYEGTLEDFNSEFNIACGLANIRLMFRNGTYNHWQSVFKDKGPAGR